MKRYTKNLVAFILAVILIISSSLPIFAAGVPSSYSSSRNSGERDVVCTSLSGTGALDYYTGEHDYDALKELSSSALLAELRELMTDTHKKQTSYANCRDYADETDCENGNTTIITLYTSYASSQGEYNGGSGWNREHVWPKSLGGFETSGAGADLHHIRPSENRTNSNRGNLKYGEVSGGKTTTGNLSGIAGGTYSSGYFEPLDNVKGDVARICLYVYVRWGAEYSKCSSITNVFQSVDVLLEWCALDPVDTWEMGRNEVVESIQGNRNVFIDYPELAWQLFGKTAPDNMTTPSGGASSGNTGSGSGGTDTPVVPDDPITPPTATVKTVGEALAASVGTDCTVEATVLATNAQSFLIGDGTGSMLVYLGKGWTPDVKAGDKLRVSGSTATYAGAVQFGQSTTYEKIGTATVSHPTPKTLDGAAADAYLNKSDITPEYVRVEGALSVSGNYYNLTIDGANIIGSLTYPAASSGVSALNGKRVTVVGYVTGVVNGKYLNLLFTSVTESVSGSCSHTNAVTVDAVDATCSADGYTGDLYCTDCGEVLDHGETIPKTGVHVWNETVDGDTVTKTCTECGKTVIESDGDTGNGDDPDTDTEYTDVYALIAELEGDEEKILILINLGALDAELIELLARNAK